MIPRPIYYAKIQQAKGYADYYGITIYILNFCLEGHVVPEAKSAHHNVVLVNITHPADCTQFSVSSFDWGVKSVRVCVSI